MKEFLKMFLASFTAGFFILLSFFLIFILIFSIGAASEPKVSIEKNSFLSIDATLGFADNPSSLGIESLLSGINAQPYKVFEIQQALKNAASDERIKGVVLNFGYGVIGGGMAAINEVRQALQEFQDSGKLVVTYGNVYSQKAYYLASVADSIFLNPNGIVEWAGIGRTATFYKEALANVGVKPVVLRPKNNKFKSAVEPYIESGLSEANRLQLTRIQDVTWNEIANAVGNSRNISREDLDRIANNFETIESEACLKNGFVDALIYSDEFDEKLKAYTNTTEKDPLLTNISDYYTAEKMNIAGSSKNQIAVLFAEGDIIDGPYVEGSIAADDIIETLREIRESKRTKGLVFRINSPGGSAFASDLIWREIALIKEKMPVVVSMGDVAASGGYYIAAPADSILVNPMTITGSIGVFGVFFTAQELLEETFKLRFDGVKTHQFADLGTLSRDLSPAEMELLEGNVTRTYGKFLNRVASGRNLDSLYVDSIGQGRVWMGPDAIQNKLADAQGGLFDAIEIVNQMAGLEADYKVVAYPKPMDPLTKILKQLNIETVSDARLRSELGPFYNDWKQLQKVLHRRGIQARMELELQP